MRTYNRREASELLGVSRTTLANWENKGIINVYQRGVGRYARCYYDAEEIDKVRDDLVLVSKTETSIGKYMERLQVEEERLKRALSKTSSRGDEVRRRYKKYQFVDHCIATFLMLSDNTVLSDVEKDVLLDLVNGKSVVAISNKNELTLERIRQIINKGTRKVFSEVRLMMETMRNYETLKRENCRLKDEIGEIKGMLGNVEVFDFGGLQDLFYEPIEDFLARKNASVRLRNALYNQEFALRDVVAMSMEKFSRLRRIGKHTTKEMNELLHSDGLHFGMTLKEMIGYGKE